MPRAKKVMFHRGIYFVTTSIRKDILLPPNALVSEIVMKSFAQAQALHDVILIDIIVQPTHVHLILQILDPTDAKDFMGQFKTEVAHAINRILGRVNESVWCVGYDNPLIPDLSTLIRKIAYIYANPSNDDGEDSIDLYTGFNTFYIREAIAKGERNLNPEYIMTYKIPRTAFSVVEESQQTADGYRLYRNTLVEGRERTFFRVSPNALFERFGITDEAEIRSYNQAIVAEVRHMEASNRAHRKREGYGVIGAKRLENTPIGAPFIPERTGKRMPVHSDDREVRIETIRWIRELYRQARLVLERWRVGDYSVPYPMGLFPPTGFRLVEPLGW